MVIPADYLERVYAGVLGKIVGVYLGRPVEGWSFERISSEIGEVDYYLHDRFGIPLVVTDDDLSGTFTFLRALPDHGNPRDLTPAQIGETWLNYIIEGRTILWWGGLGNSTEHTAYLRLKRGIPAPQSGSMATNGRVVAEQIGAQIFIDGWAMVAPGDPELAADLARRAASVSHDGEAIFGAQVIAAMEAQAFVESDIDRLIDTAVSLIPDDSTIRRLVDDLREWHAREPDWRKTREFIAARYGYDKFPGHCHLIPNHALVVHALLHGGDDLGRSLMIVNTSGWDTDCNSGNVGCLLGIKNGLAAFDGGRDWRGPVSDRLYLATADGGRGITDAVTEALHVVNVGRALVGEGSIAPKNGARFHFDLPGAVQGFRTVEQAMSAAVRVENVATESVAGERSLAIRCRGIGPEHRALVTTSTFVPPEAIDMPGYDLLASPTLHPGQDLRARVKADGRNAAPVRCRLVVRAYDADDALTTVSGPEAFLAPGADHDFVWRAPSTSGYPVAEVGVEFATDKPSDADVYLDFLSWDGAPDVVLSRPDGGTMWQRAWVNGVDVFDGQRAESMRIAQNRGTGLISQGTAQWTDYRVAADVTAYLARAVGVAVRVQGMRRYYALLLCDGSKARLVKVLGDTSILAEVDFSWSFFQPYDLQLQVRGSKLRGLVDGRLLEAEDADGSLCGGGVALICEEGCLASNTVSIGPAT